MKNLKKSHWLLIIFSVLILAGCIGMTMCLLFSNYQNVRLFKQAQNNFLRGDTESLSAAESQLQLLVRNDSDNEAAYIMLAAIAEKRKVYPEQVYYSYMAHRLNPLSQENKEQYIKSLWYARYFDRLENFLSQQHTLSDKWNQLLLYSAGRNGNLKKYKVQLSRRSNDNAVGELAFLLYHYKHLSTAQKLAALNNLKNSGAVTQEILAAKAELFLESGDVDNAEKALKEAYELNTWAFAPALGRFYAHFRSLGLALSILEKHLATYHDPIIALQTAEIYCLLKKTDKISQLRSFYQSDSGNRAMLLCYYLDALSAFAENNLTALKELIVPLRKNINTPLARFMFLCADLQEKNYAAILENYTALISRSGYGDLHDRADDMLSAFLKGSLKELQGREELLLPLAKSLYNRKKEVFTAKLILLIQKKKGNIDIGFLKDAMQRFPKDQGVIKIAIEYSLKNAPAECEKLIARFKQEFPQKAADMLRYEMMLAAGKKDFDRVSALFKKNFSQSLIGEYWNFASTTAREDDLLFLSKDPLYGPFCRALLAVKKGNHAEACTLLAQADARGNDDLLFFAAKTLGENGKIYEALEKYALFPENSPYKVDVLMNTAELLAEKGNTAQALESAAKAYRLAPHLSETQLCYADKLYRSGKLTEIPDVVKLQSASPLRKRLTPLWAAGMRQKIKESDLRTQREKTREFCRQLLSVVPGDKVALDCLQKLNKMPQ